MSNIWERILGIKILEEDPSISVYTCMQCSQYHPDNWRTGIGRDYKPHMVKYINSDIDLLKNLVTRLLRDVKFLITPTEEKFKRPKLETRYTKTGIS